MQAYVIFTWCVKIILTLSYKNEQISHTLYPFHKQYFCLGSLILKSKIISNLALHFLRSSLFVIIQTIIAQTIVVSFFTKRQLVLVNYLQIIYFNFFYFIISVNDQCFLNNILCFQLRKVIQVFSSRFYFFDFDKYKLLCMFA